MGRFTQLFPRPKPLIGVIHLPPLPGYAGSPGLERVIEKALEDLRALEAGGADGALAENEEDRPHQVEAAPETIAAMTRVSRELVLAARSAIVGVEIPLNDPWASLAVAMMSGARFVRTDYFVDPMERAEYGGPMRIDPVGLQAYRSRIGAESVLILADVQVKYARMMEALGPDCRPPRRARQKPLRPPSCQRPRPCPSSPRGHGWHSRGRRRDASGSDLLRPLAGSKL
jgi:hypothetical protein